MSHAGKIAAPFLSNVRRVRKEWIDVNGHLNMAYYHLLFDMGVDDFAPTYGLSHDYIARTRRSTFLAESHIRYVKELHLDDEVQVTMQVLGVDAKRLHLFNTLIQVKDGYIAATSEDLIVSVDLKVRKVAPWETALAANLAAIRDAHAALPAPEGAGRRIGMKK